MKLVKSFLEIEIYGEQAKIRVPNYKEFQEYRNKLKNMGEQDDAAEVMKEFLCSLGLSKEIFDQLELDHIAQIMEALTSKKK
jgi:LPS O-antigen subunit length determinant protein (WzzB/FepE family)